MKINAMQFDGTPKCATKISNTFKMEYDECQFDDDKLIVCTPKGNVIVDKNDWIIRNNEGNIYKCDPEILELLYGEVVGNHINI